MKSKRRILLFISLIVAGILLFNTVGFFCVSAIVYESVFDYRYTTNADDFFEVSDFPALTRERHTFTSNKGQMLVGYLYEDDRYTLPKKGVVVFAHGLGGGGQTGYMDIFYYLTSKGYYVFAYDATGSCTSEGWGTTGLIQSALDLHAALTYVEGDETLKTLPKCLMGHSWGGYAVAAGLYFGHDVKASASVAGYSDAIQMMMRFATATMGKATALLRPLAYVEHLILFGKYATLTAVDGINRANIPVMLIHGTADELVRYDITGIVAHKDEITNPNVIIYPMSDKGQDAHSTIFHNAKSVEEIARINARLSELEQKYGQNVPNEERQRVLDGADLDLYNLPNDKLLGDINTFFEEALKK